LKDERDLGVLGESALTTWCAQVGITCNPVKQDRTGWDSILEFPLPDAVDGPADKIPAPVRCRVQVKATDGTGGRIALKLSNWVRLVRDPGPAFILVAEFDGRDECQRAFLVHVGEDLIRRVLKRLRELSHEGQFNRLNKRWLSFSYGPADALMLPTGRALREAIHAYVTPNLEGYLKWKAELLSNAGYEETTREIKFTFDVPESRRDVHPEDLLVDFDIGLLKKLQISGGAIWDTRFGIRDAKPEMNLMPGSEVTASRPPNRVGDLVLRGKLSGSEIRLPCELYVPSGVAHLVSKERMKFRFQLPGGELVMSPGQHITQFNFSIPQPDVPQRVETVLGLAKLIGFLDSACNRVSEQIVVAFAGLQFGELGLKTFQIPQYLAQWLETMSQLQRVLSHFDLPAAAELVQEQVWQSRIELGALDRILNGMRGDFRVTGFLPADPESEPACYPCVVGLPLGPLRCVVSSALIGKIEMVGDSGEFEMVPDSKFVLRKHVLLPDESLPVTKEEMLEEVFKRFNDGHNVLIWWRQSSST